MHHPLLPPSREWCEAKDMPDPGVWKGLSRAKGRGSNLSGGGRGTTPYNEVTGIARGRGPRRRLQTPTSKQMLAEAAVYVEKARRCCCCYCCYYYYVRYNTTHPPLPYHYFY